MCCCHNTGACSVSTTYRWICFLQQITLQRRANRQLRSSTRLIETTDLLIQLHPSGVIQYPIGKPRYTALSILMEMKCLGSFLKRWLSPTVSKYFTASARLSSNLYGPLLILVVLQETVFFLVTGSAAGIIIKKRKDNSVFHIGL